MVVVLTGSSLTNAQLNQIADGSAVRISTEAWERVSSGRKRLLELSASRKVVIYGTSTGVGVHKKDSPDDNFALHILTAHATRNVTCCMVKPCPAELVSECRQLVRESLTILCNHYCTGCTGVSTALVNVVLTAIASLHDDQSFAVAAVDELWNVLDIPSTGARATDVDMGAIVANSAVAVWLLRASGYHPQVGEALPLMSYNALAIANARRLSRELRCILSMQALSCAATLCALNCDPAPFSSRTLESRSLPTTPEAADHRAAVHELLEFTGPDFLRRQKRELQNPLSVRCFAMSHAVAMCRLRQLNAHIEHAVNTNPINPIVCSDTVSTSPLFDTFGLRLCVDVVKLAVAEAAARCYSRMVNTLDPGHNGGLPLGLGEIHNRNVPTIASSTLVAMQAAATCPGGNLTVRMADGVEDVCSGLSGSCASAFTLCRHAATLATCEFAVAFEAAVCQSDAVLDPTAVPPLLRTGRVEVASASAAGLLAEMRNPHSNHTFNLGDLQNKLRDAVQDRRAPKL